jgi:hypothetical protein
VLGTVMPVCRLAFDQSFFLHDSVLAYRRYFVLSCFLQDFLCDNLQACLHAGVIACRRACVHACSVKAFLHARVITRKRG